MSCGWCVVLGTDDDWLGEFLGESMTGYDLDLDR